MAGKRKPAKLAIRGVGGGNKNEEPIERFRVVDPQGVPIYLASEEGLSLPDAVRLATGLVTPGGISQIGPDGELYPGNVDLTNPAEPVFTSVTPIPEPPEEEAA